MKTPLVRVDLCQDARDFKPIALEPGVGILDPSGANATVMSRWLGRFAAHPEWNEEVVSFCLRDEPQASQPEIVCRPVTVRRLKGPLREEWEALRERAQTVKPANRDEKLLHKWLVQAFRDFGELPTQSDIGSRLLEYRDPEGNWRLLWLWGFQRADNAAATGVTCPKESCSLLYILREGVARSGRKCPHCFPELAARGKKGRSWSRRAFWILLLIAAHLIGFWFFGFWPMLRSWIFGPNGRLEASPNPVVVWLDGTSRFGQVQAIPEEAEGDGTPVATEYRVEFVGPDEEPGEDGEPVEVENPEEASEPDEVEKPVDAETPEPDEEPDIPATPIEPLDTDDPARYLKIEPEGGLTGLAEGEVDLRVIAVAPGEWYDALATEATARITRLKDLRLDPKGVTLELGETSPPFVATGLGVGNLRARVPAELESLDEEILAPLPDDPTRFTTLAMGGTTIRATYLDKSATVHVSVTGDRFARVETTSDESADEIRVIFEVFSRREAGKFEYRVFAKGGTPPETWVAPKDDTEEERKATLRSPPIAYGPPSERYRLVIEARDTTDESIERYLFTFRIGREIARVDDP